jgi:ketosteroid isomerase-like protein
MPKHVNWSNATGAEQYERLMWQAIRDKDWKAVEYRLSPTFIGTTPGGQALERNAWVEQWKGAPVADFSLGEVTVQPSGHDMVVTYVLTLTGTPKTAQPAPALRVISVWQAVKSGWVLTASSMTPIRP